MHDFTRIEVYFQSRYFSYVRELTCIHQDCYDGVVTAMHVKSPGGSEMG